MSWVECENTVTYEGFRCYISNTSHFTVFSGLFQVCFASPEQTRNRAATGNVRKQRSQINKLTRVPTFARCGCAGLWRLPRLELPTFRFGAWRTDHSGKPQSFRTFFFPRRMLKCHVARTYKPLVRPLRSCTTLTLSLTFRVLDPPRTTLKTASVSPNGNLTKYMSATCTPTYRARGRRPMVSAAPDAGSGLEVAAVGVQTSLVSGRLRVQRDIDWCGGRGVGHASWARGGGSGGLRRGWFA